MFEIEIPKRTLLLLGPQRCGKTTAMVQMLKCAVADKRRVLLIGLPVEMNDLKLMAEVGGITQMPLAATDAHHYSPGMFDVVIMVGSSLFHEPGRISLYHEPSEGVRDFLRRVRDSDDLLPYVMCETHYEGTERDVGERKA